MSVSQFSYLLNKDFLCFESYLGLKVLEALTALHGLWRSCTVLNLHLFCFTGSTFNMHLQLRKLERGAQEHHPHFFPPHLQGSKQGNSRQPSHVAAGQSKMAARSPGIQ